MCNLKACSLEICFKDSELASAYVKIPKELKEAIDQSTLNVSEILRTGLYHLLDFGFLKLPGFNQIDLMTQRQKILQSNQEDDPHSKKWETNEF